MGPVGVPEPLGPITATISPPGPSETRRAAPEWSPNAGDSFPRSMISVFLYPATAGRSAVTGALPREQVQPGRGVVDPSKVSSVGKERIGEEHAS